MPSASTSVASTCAVPWCKSTRARLASGASADARWRYSTSRMWVGTTSPGWASTSPRSTSSTPTPGRLIAARWPAIASSAGPPWISTPRARVARPRGSTTSSSPGLTRPPHSVPVATVPKPLIVKTRSTGRRSTPVASRGVSARALAASWARSASRPAPVRADTGTIGASARNEPASCARTSAVTSSSQSSSTRSRLVSTTSPPWTPSSWQMSRCSRVCGMTPSSAAITRQTRSTPPAPATIARTKRSWPGTSITAARRPSSSRWAKPSSVVMPRFFSTGRRSVSMPVSAMTSDVLPWSMCPAVPITSGGADTSAPAARA